MCYTCYFVYVTITARCWIKRGTGCVTPVTLCILITTRRQSEKRNWNRGTCYKLCYTCLFVCSSYSKVLEQKEELEQKPLLQPVLHLSPCVFQLQQGVGAERGTGTEALFTGCVTPITLYIPVTARCQSRRRNWNRSICYSLCYTCHLVCSSYSKVLDQKEELEQKHLLQPVLHLCNTCHLVCSSYSKVLEQKEELEQKHLHLLQILDSERQAKWHYVQQTEELSAEVKKLKEEVSVGILLLLPPCPPPTPNHHLSSLWSFSQC